MATIDDQVPDINIENAIEPMEVSTNDEIVSTPEDGRERDLACDQIEVETNTDPGNSESSETATASNSDEVNLIPVEGNPKQAKVPLRKRRRPPQQLVLLPSMTIPEALKILNYNLKLSLVIGFQDTALALRLLRDLMDLKFTSTDIEQVKDLVSTLRKVRHFKHNSRVRNRAEELYTKIKSLYVIGEVRSVNKQTTKHKPSHLISKINEGAKPPPKIDEENNTNSTPVDKESAVKDKEKSQIDQELTKDKENQKPTVQPVRRSLRNRNKSMTGGGSGSEKDQVVPSSSQ